MGPGFAILGAVAALSGAAPAAHCPTGVPVQPITVVNQAHVRSFALAKVERAVVDQSMQLRAAWGTPCVRFAAGGWPVHLRIGGTEHGFHWGLPHTYADVYTGGLSFVAWSQVFSHEIVEMLVNPDNPVVAYYAGEKTIQVVDPSNPAGSGNAIEELVYPIEVADPVEERGYRLDGVWVSDFVFRAYYAGATSVPTGGCDPSRSVPCGPSIAAADTPPGRPYDQMGILTGPWQTQWERANPS